MQLSNHLLENNNDGDHRAQKWSSPALRLPSEDDTHFEEIARQPNGPLKPELQRQLALLETVQERVNVEATLLVGKEHCCLHDDINQRLALLSVELDQWCQHTPTTEGSLRKPATPKNVSRR